MSEEFEYIDFAFRTESGAFVRNIKKISELESLQSRHIAHETFASIFTYPENIIEYADKNRINGKPSVAGYRGPVNALIAPVFDIDSESNIDDALQTARELYGFLTDKLAIPPEYTGVFFSGHKGFHLYTSAGIFGTEPSTDLHRIFKNLGNTITNRANLSNPATVDKNSCSNKVSLLRLPSSINFGSGLYKTQITPHELDNFSVDDIKDKARERQNEFYFVDRTGLFFDSVETVPAAQSLFEYVRGKTRKRNAKEPVNKTHVNGLCPAIEGMLKTGYPSGERSQAAIRIVSALNLADYPIGETERIAMDWNRMNDNDPPFTDRELSGIVNYIYRKGGYRYSCRDDLISQRCPYTDRKRCEYLKSKKPVPVTS